ncbi:hypothetical protein A3D78_00975 [Candidatus Gottesmanbacteria bacterium RIFCSPHIGHO2_02_FULL_39_14]|uniref:Uncharacterized protein n=3 Tax=Candidatus Gottesmaniibacteriota TaxID=1752720 RepID=A0A1F6A0B5_9BACT|nr:MAG: hypothetical protein A2153_06220 [Candidatus Gottesmanbacteria bacterium RBG_16_38_7b]OGG18054.1 MAG: hypothetical protein A3D78_00975 [Candidatus Gottesmanbacteria bacterium RIFCSPHIGHO2_02_FULL_39_14]OGG32399.1 MAG: hypothetical protein A3I51_03870 [Candidatus Gottesmanbacteria bacterium RIFCSPLOWO2_02_FULL_38_8]
MKAIVFAGGVGTRLWPLSRRSSPKQFEAVIDDKSTLQLSIERLLPDFDWKDIYLSTNYKYLSAVQKQLPFLPQENIIVEPETRDVGPAVALITSIFVKKYPREPIVILWSDHLIKNMGVFKKILKVCRSVISKKPQQMIFISQKPRFASQNLGWIKFGKIATTIDNIPFYTFSSFFYRPDLKEAESYFQSGRYAWNTGYFVTTPLFLWTLFKKFQPEIFRHMVDLKKAVSNNFKSVLDKIYPQMPKISFDNAILEKINPAMAYVIPADLGWSDIGAWEALKEALQTSRNNNVVRGKVVVTDCLDSLVYNYTDQLVVTIDLNGYLVVNTHDVVLVCHKNSVPKIKKLVERLGESENQHLV